MSIKNIVLNLNNAKQTSVAQYKISGGEGGVGAKGKPVRIKAQANVKYQFTDEATGYAPENIAAKRVGKDLQITFEGGDVAHPDLIIQDYYADGMVGYGEGADNLLIGQAENGMYYNYIPESAEVTDAVSLLVDGVQAGQETRLLQVVDAVGEHASRYQDQEGAGPGEETLRLIRSAPRYIR